MKLFLSVLLLLVSISIYGQSQYPNKSKLDLKEIMKGNDFVGYLPENHHWHVNGRDILFYWNPEKEPGNSLYRFNTQAKIRSYEKVNYPPVDLSYDLSQRDYEIQYSILEGNLISYNKKTNQVVTIIQSLNPIRSVQRCSDPTKIYYQQGNNLYLFDQKNGTTRQISNFISGDEKKIDEDSTQLMKQATELFDFVRKKNAKSEWMDKQEVFYKEPLSVYFGKSNLENIQISMDGNFISFRLADYPKEKETEVEYHISNDGYSYIRPAREKVGDQDPSKRLGIIDLIRDTVYFIDFSKLTDIRVKPSYLNDNQLYEKDRKITIHSLKFSAVSKTAICDVRAYDNKDRWIVLIDLETGKVTELDKQHDEAWIGGPGISGWNDEEGTLGWTKDYASVYFQSEATGYSHLYLCDIKSGKKQQLTSGNWEVYEAQLSMDGKKFFLTTNMKHPGNRNFYHLEIASKKLTSILSEDGNYEVSISPDEKKLAIRYSYKNKPWELFYSLNAAGSKMEQLTHSTTKEFENFKWMEPECITFKGSDGKDVYARLYKPNTATANSTAIIFVHGAGYLQNAHNYWSNYFREYMFHNLLTENGFTVLDIDYRASEGYGRDYRTAIYRHMGGRDLQDHIDGKKFLVDNYNIDPDRVGIYGGSYGGFITLMGMLSTPGEFNCGAALRSVTDWAHYNHEYTSNILNYPGTDPEAYRKSSPIYFAEGLNGRLIMLHGMVDDNVQFQDVVRLSQRFIELGKENWELAVFPVESHGFKENSSWYDEYRRIYELFYHELLIKPRK